MVNARLVAPAVTLEPIEYVRIETDRQLHIKAYWVMMTPRMAQIALKFGADDLDGTIVEERIYHDAGATTSQGLRRHELLRAAHRIHLHGSGVRRLRLAAVKGGGAGGGSL